MKSVHSMDETTNAPGYLKTRNLSNRDLLELFEGGDQWDPIDEIVRIFKAIAPSTDPDLLLRTHETINQIFSGTFPGFKGGLTEYHDLRHTRNVVLAAARLLHGLTCQGIHLSPEIIQLGLISAYFHDTGMLLTDKDAEKTGAAYLKCHEERSIQFLQRYLKDNGFKKKYLSGCAVIIQCTNLMVDPRTLTFPSPEIRIAAEVVGSADIMAQMADRYYLESLPLLFLEFHSAGVDRYQSSLELMKQTARFYHDVIKQRLLVAFDNTIAAAQCHFREWWHIDQNLYMEFIAKNVAYLERALLTCNNEEECMTKFLRRKIPKIES